MSTRDAVNLENVQQSHRWTASMNCLSCQVKTMTILYTVFLCGCNPEQCLTWSCWIDVQAWFTVELLKRISGVRIRLSTVLVVVCLVSCSLVCLFFLSLVDSFVGSFVGSLVCLFVGSFVGWLVCLSACLCYSAVHVKNLAP